MSSKNANANQALEERLIEFASRIIELVESLPKTPAAKHMGSQLLRSGTAPALNYGEAQSAESPEDFLHKMKICLKELRETIINLKIINKRQWFPEKRLQLLLAENSELIAIFTASTKTVSNRIRKN